MGFDDKQNLIAWCGQYRQSMKMSKSDLYIWINWALAMISPAHFISSCYRGAINWHHPQLSTLSPVRNPVLMSATWNQQRTLNYAPHFHSVSVWNSHPVKRAIVLQVCFLPCAVTNMPPNHGEFSHNAENKSREKFWTSELLQS